MPLPRRGVDAPVCLFLMERVHTMTVGEQNFILNDQNIYQARILDFSHVL